MVKCLKCSEKLENRPKRSFSLCEGGLCGNCVLENFPSSLDDQVHTGDDQ
jgi:hypothetical protein